MTEIAGKGGRPAMASAVDGDLPAVLPPEERGSAWGKAGTAWAIFEFARNPYYILVIIYIFAPYLSRDVVGHDALMSGLFDHLPPQMHTVRPLWQALPNGQAPPQL